MSLLVWLPLNGDLHNQGCGNVTITANAGETYYNNGKIGKAFNLNKRITFNCPQLNGLSTFSITFWGQPMTSSTLTTNWQDLLGFTDVSTSGTTGQFRFETCYNYAAGNGVHWHDNATNAIVNGSWTGPAEKGTWHHYAVIVKKNEYIKTYFDGILQSTITTNLYGGYLNGQFWIGETNNIEGMINDVRVYNHCLSAAEVHEIAQGLVLHYKLDGPMGGAGENFVINGDGRTALNTYWSNWGTATERQIIEINGKKWFNFKTDPNGNYGGFSQDRGLALYKPNTNYTISALMYAAEEVSGRLWVHTRSTEGGSNLAQYLTTVSVFTSPQTYTFTFNTGTNTSYTINKVNLMIGAVSATKAIDFYISNIKIEEGTKATSWIPCKEELGINDTIITDSSGYNNNAISNGSVALTYSPDTPRYNLSAQFISGARIMSPMAANAFLPTDAMTVNIWFKSTNPSNRFISCTEGGGWNFEVASGKVRFSVYVKGKGYELNQGNTTWSSLGDDKWHMLTGVYDRTYSKIYIDGELDNTFTLANPGLDIGYNAGAVPFCLGAEAQTISSPIAGTYVGNLSDLRIYCTPLLDTDIKMLYNTSMRVDNLGGIHCFEFDESLNTKTSLQKNVLKTSEICETFNIAKIGKSSNILLNDLNIVTTNSTNIKTGSLGIIPADIMKTLAGKTLTFSYDICTSGARYSTEHNLTAYNEIRYGIHGGMPYTNSSGTTGTNYPFASNLTYSGDATRVYSTWTIPADYQVYGDLSFAIQNFDKPSSTNTNTWYIKNIRLEVTSQNISGYISGTNLIEI